VSRASPRASEPIGSVAANLAALRARVGDGVEILAVTKGFGPDAIAAAAAAGCRAIGENYAQELVAKAPAARAAGVAVHFIGQLQTNKVRQLAGLVDMWESVDRARLVAELARRAPGARILVQVDTTGEEGKGGCPLPEVPALVRAATDAGLEVAGLMTVGPTEGGPEAARPGFRAVRALVDELGLTTCSMGMSADLDVALEEGTTEIRVGTALFGPRPRRSERP
jgi:pyridoxal phosphate enzyme (YggS family)